MSTASNDPGKRRRPPDHYKGLKWERAKLMQIGDQLRTRQVPLNNEAGSRRRIIIEELGEIAIYPSRPKLIGGLLQAIWYVTSYDDVVSVALIDSIVEDYVSWIANAKERYKASKSSKSSKKKEKRKK